MAKLTFSNLTPEARAKLEALMNRPLSVPEKDKKTYIPQTDRPKKKRLVTPPPVDPYVEKVRPVQIWLETTWPSLFDLKNPKPLKRRIELDILPHLPSDFTKTQLRRALAAYTGREVYLKAVLKMGVRYDLDGNPVEDIPDAQKTHTKNRRDRKKSRIKSKPHPE